MEYALIYAGEAAAVLLVFFVIRATATTITLKRGPEDEEK